MQLIYRPLQDVSEHIVGHLALLDRLPATTLAAPHYLSSIPRIVHFTESSRSGHSAPGKDYDDDFSESVSIGSLRKRLPVAAKIALVTAALTMAVGASPTPP